jgi:molybdate transport system ATP-binding protein
MKLIEISNCKICQNGTKVFQNFSWTFNQGEVWLILGSNNGKKNIFIKTLEESSIKKNSNLTFEFVPVENGIFSNTFTDSLEIVSLEKAASLIEEERINDESEFIEGGIDIGRTARVFISEVLNDDKSKSFELAKKLETYPEVKLCGIEKVLDRGLKYLSTGEIRRTLLCRALLSGKKLILLSDPFAGLDVDSRKLLLEFFDKIASKQGNGFPFILLSMERYTEIPSSVTHVLEFTKDEISFCGTKNEFEKIYQSRLEKEKSIREQKRQELLNSLATVQTESSNIKTFNLNDFESLVKMKDVKVAWGENTVLENFSWELKPFEHTLIRGPNGSGKTTLLELITGDNMQVFCNDVSIFGRRRGTGETIWELKEKMGIVSYRLHLEYRMLGGIDIEAVILSGFHDSIGLYESRSQVEQFVAKQWLNLAGFSGREKENFQNLSYGEQRAILILRAAVKCPPLLILDEPCHGLDEENRTMVLDLLETIASTGTTTLLHVTHEADEVLSCEKNIIQLLPGQKPMYKLINLCS